MEITEKPADQLTPDELAFARALEASLYTAAASYHLQASNPCHVSTSWRDRPAQLQVFELVMKAREAFPMPRPRRA